MAEGDGAHEADLERREADLERREADLERREAVVAAREAALAERVEAAQAVLDAADERDTVSDARDDVADKREYELDRAQFLAQDSPHEYGGDLPIRRESSLDREHAKGDRQASHEDRTALTEGDAEPRTEET